MAKQNLGMVTAYAYAVVGGYEGTEAEFEALLGNIATDLAEIENLTVIANTLPEGSQATASYSDGVLTLGIPKGDTGATGAGATVTIGTTATGDPGTNASVTNSGTTKDAVFNFTIPRGDTGNGIESIYLTGTSGAVKTYTILFTDGTTTTFDVTDGEVTNATLTAVLADYAKIDGAYESMTVGNAEQLVSTVFVNDEEPYNFRTAGGSADIGDREYDTVVGGTVAWNQLLPTLDTFSAESGVTKTYSDGVATITSTIARNGIYAPLNYQTGHKYLFMCDLKTETAYSVVLGATSAAYVNKTVTGDNQWHTIAGVSNSSASMNTNAYVYATAVYANLQVRNYSVIDLTQMFGSTIADYIYSLETANAGAGVAWFRKLFPKPYYAYNAGELMSVNTSAHNTVGFNAWDEEWEQGGINQTTGANTSNSNAIRSKNYIRVVPNATYYVKAPIAVRGYWYDADKNYIKTESLGVNTTFTVPSGACYLRFIVGNSTTPITTYGNDICINLSWDGERDGEYEEYVKHSYQLDSTLTLRGIPKLDASNNLYYDGEVHESDGKVSRRYLEITFDGTENWVASTNANRYYCDLNSTTFPYKYATGINAMASNGFSFYGAVSGSTYLPDRQFALWYAASSPTSTLREIMCHDTSCADVTAWKEKLASSPMTVLFETDATTETADPFQSPQIVDDFGTEEYVDYAMSEGDRDVAIPVGHITKYTNNLRAKLEMSPNSPDGAGDYLVRQTNGINEYVSLSSNATIQDMLARIEALEGGGE